MTLSTKLFAATLLGSVLTFSAHAADTTVHTTRTTTHTSTAYAPAPETGFYVGGQIGYAFDASADYVYDSGSDPDYDYSNDPDGFIGGLYAGYSYQFANGIVIKPNNGNITRHRNAIFF